MATGNKVLPGAPVTTERAVTAEQQMMAGRGTGSVGWASQDTGYVSGGPVEQAQRTARRTAGGRWIVWVLRALVWAVLLLIGYRGVAAIVTSYEGKSGSAGGAAGAPGTGQAADGFPVSLASAFALEFGQVYLNFSPATAAARASELAPFLPAGTDAQLGWNGSGSQTVQSVQPAGVDVRSANSAVVSLLAEANGRLIELSVPIYYADGGLVVSGQPALIAPPVGIVPPAGPKVTQDRLAQQTLSRLLPAFFRAYASGSSSQLAAFAAPGTRLSGLGGEVGFGSIVNVSVPTTGGSASSALRNITVTVAWLPVSTPSAGPPNPSAGGRAQIDMTYSMTVVQRAGRWYVSSIGASTALAGQSP
ncbi:MAG TPA: conjugal transfer protein [Streptosporangiaceae bacterium]|nr:conjugal transfer protein [Streptosporangiaceae bacterium]